MVHVEDRTFTLRFSLEARVRDEYEGEEDEYAWVDEWETAMKPDVIKAVFSALRKHPGWTARVRNRGASEQDEIEIVVAKDLGASHG